MPEDHVTRLQELEGRLEALQSFLGFVTRNLAGRIGTTRIRAETTALMEQIERRGEVAGRSLVTDLACRDQLDDLLKNLR